MHAFYKSFLVVEVRKIREAKGTWARQLLELEKEHEQNWRVLLLKIQEQSVQNLWVIRKEHLGDKKERRQPRTRVLQDPL